MNLLDLPEEILIKIIRSLDTKSLLIVYNTCSYFRYIISIPGVIKVCKLSLNNKASAHYLNFKLFRDLESHLQKLDMSCVPNLDMTLLLNTLMTMKVLRVLDVSYTTINIMDLIEIHLICPTINDICINFNFGITPWLKIPPEILEECKTLFESFKNVNFVGNYESLYWSNLPLSLLQKARLSKLQLTITGCNLPFYESSEKIEVLCEIDQIVVYLLNWKPRQISHSYLNDFYLASMLDIKKCECIYIEWCNPIEHYVCSSPLFQKFFKEKLNINSICLNKMALRGPMGGNVVFMVWNKESTVFDEGFYNSLFRHLHAYFPHYHESLNETSALPPNSDWLYIYQLCQTSLCDHTLDLDSATAGKETLKLSICTPNNPQTCISLPAANNYLHKITYISLSSVLCHGKNFFSLLFRSCIKLETVNLAFEQYSSAVLCHLAEALPISKSLKNFRLVSPYLEMQSILFSMSRCTNLENIQIVDLCSAPQPLSLSRAIFENCANLYSYVVAMEMPPEARARKLKILNKFRLEYRRYHLYIELHSREFCEFSYDPFIGVFDLCPIKPF